MAGWNGSGMGGNSTPIKPKATAKKPSPVRGLVAGAVLVAAVIGCYFAFFSGSEKPQKVVEQKKPTAIKEVKPAAAPKAVEKVKPEKPKRLTKKGTPIPDRVQPDEHGVLRWPGGLRWVDTNDLDIVKHPAPRRIFKHPSENQIAMMLEMDPTKMAPFLVGHRPKFGDRFIADFNASLYEEIKINDDDPPEDVELKKAVIETKKELHEAMNRGENIAEIMNNAQKELDALCLCYQDIKQEMQKTLKDDTVSDEDAEIFIEAANKILEQKGLNKFSLPNMARRQGILAAQRERRERKAAEAAAAQAEQTQQ